MATRQDLVIAARSYLDVRWHHQGRNRAGIDCIGLQLVPAWDVGLTAVDYDGYARTSDGSQLRAELERNMRRVVGEPQPADVLLMRFSPELWHLAMVTDKGIIHAAAAMRKVVEHGLNDWWRARIVAAYAWPEFVDG